MVVGKNIKWKLRKGKQYLLPFNIEAVGKKIKWGKREVDENFEKKIKI